MGECINERSKLLKYLNEFLFIKVEKGWGGETGGGGVGVLEHVYVWEHIMSLNYRIA